MKATLRIFAAFGLLVGLVTTAAPVGADTFFSIYTQVPHPQQYTNEVIWVSLALDQDGVFPKSGIPVHTVWNYKTSMPTLDWQTGYDGNAAMVRNIGPATCGYTVRVDIYIGDDQQQIDSTYFTPCY